MIEQPTNQASKQANKKDKTLLNRNILIEVLVSPIPIPALVLMVQGRVIGRLHECIHGLERGYADAWLVS